MGQELRLYHCLQGEGSPWGLPELVGGEGYVLPVPHALMPCCSLQS